MASHGQWRSIHEQRVWGSGMALLLWTSEFLTAYNDAMVNIAWLEWIILDLRVSHRTETGLR